ncbi:GIY-YIG nuclease family protein [Bacillus cereus group sp. BceL310]|uniref:GIY-YIG nuclease family protein n=1 Tax=Bacillus cereus group sp. BceL310 TaxID=3444975 RepID=UPI003EC59514
MDNNGYVYVLINPAIPEMVKVGMTTRDPEDRVEELSSATGVPNQFILVYKERFVDCVLAEKMAHEILEARGCRVAQNREFFNVAIPEAINVVLEVKKHLQEHKSVETNTNKLAVKSTQTDNIKDLISGLLETAKSHYFGTNDTLEDHKEATKLFKKAAKLGSGEANRFLGDMILGLEDRSWYYGNISNKINKSSLVIEKALECYKQGQKNGDRVCIARMGNVYSASFGEGGMSYHLENSFKCWELYIKKIRSDGAEDLDAYIILKFIEYLNEELRGTDSFKRNKFFKWVKDSLLDVMAEIILVYYADYSQIYGGFEKVKINVQSLANPKEADLFMVLNRGYSDYLSVDIVCGQISIGDQIEVFGGDYGWFDEIKTIKTIRKYVDDTLNDSVVLVECSDAVAGEEVYLELYDTEYYDYDELKQCKGIYITKPYDEEEPLIFQVVHEDGTVLCEGDSYDVNLQIDKMLREELGFAPELEEFYEGERFELSAFDYENLDEAEIQKLNELGISDNKEETTRVIKELFRINFVYVQK